MRVAFCGETRKALIARLQQADAAHTTRLVRRIHALLALAFAEWGSLGYTWALNGIQPTVKTRGIRKAYRVLGLLDCFGGKPYQRGLVGQLNSTTYQDFLVWVLTQATGQLLIIQDNVSCHTSAARQAFSAEHADRLAVEQLPPYSPELNPIEALWKKVKKDATHLRWFPHVDILVSKVRATLDRLTGLPRELNALAGEYRFLTPATE